MAWYSLTAIVVSVERALHAEEPFYGTVLRSTARPFILKALTVRRIWRRTGGRAITHYNAVIQMSDWKTL